MNGRVNLRGAVDEDILGFGQLGLHDRPGSRASGHKSCHDGERGLVKKDFEVPGPHGVANAMNAPIAQTSNRGRGNFVRDILAPAKCAPWRNSPVQLDFLRGARAQDRTFYRELSQAIYTVAGAHGPDIASSLRGLDRHRCGFAKRQDFLRVLRGLRDDLPVDSLEALAVKLDTRRDRSVDVELFLDIFWKDQQRTPAGEAAPAPRDHRDDDDRVGDNHRKPHRASAAAYDPDYDARYVEPSALKARPQATLPETTPRTLNRATWLRAMLRQNGGVRGQYRTVAKLLRLFQEASWKGQDQLLHCLRAGDRRQTGAMRHQQFVRAMRTLGIYMSEHDYAELFKLFDQDNSGDITLDELTELLDETHTGHRSDHDHRAERGYAASGEKQPDHRDSRSGVEEYDVHRDGRRGHPRGESRGDSRHEEAFNEDRDRDRRQDRDRDQDQRQERGQDQDRDRRQDARPRQEARPREPEPPRDYDYKGGYNSNSARGYDDFPRQSRHRHGGGGDGDGGDRSTAKYYLENEARPLRRSSNHCHPESGASSSKTVNARHALEQRRRQMLKGQPEVTWRAFKRVTSRLNELMPPLTERRLMDAVDLDRSASVDRRELGRGLRQLGLYVAEDDIDALFKCLDADGNGTIDAGEMCILLDL